MRELNINYRAFKQIVGSMKTHVASVPEGEKIKPGDTIKLIAVNDANQPDGDEAIVEVAISDHVPELGNSYTFTFNEVEDA